MLASKIKTAAAVGILVAANASAFWAGWSVSSYRWQAKYSDLAASHSAELHRINNEYVSDVAVMAEAADTLRAEIAAKDHIHTEIVNNARTQQDGLRRAIRDGERRLSVLVRKVEDRNCTAMPEAEPNAGLDDGQARAELDPAFAERIVAITNDGDEAIRQLTALQAVCTMKTKTQ